MRYQALRGMHDILPSDVHRWQALERSFSQLARRYGYEEIRTPILEMQELFLRSSGETSEVVTKQMYAFVDKGGREVALKPEETAPAVRAYLEHKLGGPGQITRLYYITPIFRYERPQKGRLRQAHQLGLELFGSPSPQADAEIIEISLRMYGELGLRDLTVLLNCVGREATREGYGKALLSHMKSFLANADEETNVRAQKNPLRLLDSKDEAIQDALKGRPPISEYLEPASMEHFAEVQSRLREAQVPFVVRDDIVRGLDYYTDTVFEIHSTSLGAQSALCGGGRFDNLIAALGGPPTPAVGVGMGIERALIAQEAAGTVPDRPRPDAFVVCASASAEATTRAITATLRDAGRCALRSFQEPDLKKQLKEADRSRAKWAVIVGEDELQREKWTLRNLDSGEQTLVTTTELVARLEENA
jgi:histidyl-tRNA synthetase